MHRAQALPLQVGADADRAEGHHGDLPAVGGHDFCPHIQHMADEFLGPLHDQIQFRHKVRILTQHMDYEVFQATGPVHIPKGLPGQMLHGGVIRRHLPADDDVFCFMPLSSLHPSAGNLSCLH